MFSYSSSDSEDKSKEWSDMPDSVDVGKKSNGPLLNLLGVQSFTLNEGDRVEGEPETMIIIALLNDKLILLDGSSTLWLL